VTPRVCGICGASHLTCAAWALDTAWQTTVPRNATKQLTLFPTASDVSVERVLVYYCLPEHMRWGFTPTPRLDRGLGV
jgi:Ni,Fe-hydrogenase I large subunit